ncbi:hypothetical protein B7P43_G04057, partial [Cryptotermes secundus]
SRHFRNRKRGYLKHKIDELAMNSKNKNIRDLYRTQLLNVHRVSAVRQTEMHTAEPLIPDPSPFEVEIAVANLKRYKSPGAGHGSRAV